MAEMTPSRFARRFAFDVTSAFAVYSGIAAFGVFGTASAGSAHGLLTTAPTGQITGVVLLGVTISVLYALNLAFYRHLKTVYAPESAASHKSVGQDQA